VNAPAVDLDVEARWFARAPDGALSLLHREVRLKGAELQVVAVEADDGVAVPVSLVQPAGPLLSGGWPALLEVYGGSDGQAAVARDPSAFGAAIGAAGGYDLLRARRFGRWWPDGYGRLSDPAQAAVLCDESPIHLVPAGLLPPVLLVTGQVDPIVALEATDG
jgi:hypothetical protein